MAVVIKMFDCPVSFLLGLFNSCIISQRFYLGNRTFKVYLSTSKIYLLGMSL